MGLWSGYQGDELRPAGPSLPRAGWYPDPHGPGRRWWDGQRWTEYHDSAYGPQLQPPPVVYVQAPQTGGAGALVVVGWVTAVLFPIAGVILGIVATTRRDEPDTSRHGPWIIVASVISFVLWYVLIAAIQNSWNSWTYY